jgi:hypothetical protein
LSEKIRSKALPTSEGKKITKKRYIIEYAKNRPISASEVAKKLDTTTSYVWKVLSQERNLGKKLRGRKGRIFAHGKAWYEWAVMPESFSKLSAPVINPKTGMKQVGFIGRGDPCSCQIHPNGHLIVWTRAVNWKEWLSKELTVFGWSRELAQIVIENLKLNLSQAECGVKPKDSSFLPGECFLETEWGLVVVRDNTPENGVLELKLSVPKLDKFLGLPEIKKTLDSIQQGSMTHIQSHKTMEALLISLYRILQGQNRLPADKEGGQP